MKSVLSTVPTGNVIKNYLDAYHLTQKELSIRTGISEKHLSHLLNGTSRLTEEVALKLEKVLTPVPASYWLQYETKYREAVAREQEPVYSYSKQALQEIAKRFHFKEVFGDLGWNLEKQATEMLSLLQISDYSQFGPTYAALSVSFMEDGGSLEPIAIWLNLCREELEIQNEDLSLSYSARKLEKTLNELKHIAYEGNASNSLLRARKLLNALGIYLVIYPAISNSKVRGALTTYKGNPAIYLSLRYKTHDHAWFALMHEIGHLLLHYESKRTIISCEQDESSTASQETEANQFAETFFLDTTAYEAFCYNKVFSHAEVRAFAETQHVHPGIVVSRLQHEQIIPYSHLNTLKSKITLIEA